MALYQRFKTPSLRGSLGSKSIPLFAPPIAGPATVNLISIVFASERTSFSVSPLRIRVPPPAAPPLSELMTTQPLASVSASCQWKTTSAGRSSKARSCSFIYCSVNREPKGTF